MALTVTTVAKRGIRVYAVPSPYFGRSEQSIGSNALNHQDWALTELQYQTVRQFVHLFRPLVVEGPKQVEQ